MNKQRVQGILSQLRESVHGKDEIIAVSFLGALAGLNTFLLGPPGTAKSLIARRITSAFESGNYFELLMNKFTTPEEVFGPIKLSELKHDNYVRKTEGYLPEADVAFLDEIWKANSAILNTLLTIINEKKFKNGSGEPKKVPLKVLISASNETPQEGHGLEALYDRFAIRLKVDPIRDWVLFEKIIEQAPANPKAEIEDRVTNDDLEYWDLAIDETSLAKDTKLIIHQIRERISKHNDERNDTEKPIYISDRHWQKAARLLKAHAFFCDRDETNLVDIFLLRHCLWSDENERLIIENIISDVVSQNGFASKESYNNLEKASSKVCADIKKKLLYSATANEDIVDYEVIQRKKYITSTIDCKEDYPRYGKSAFKLKLFVPFASRGTDRDFHPLGEKRTELKQITCNFKRKRNSYTISIQKHTIRRPRQVEFKKTLENPIRRRTGDDLYKKKISKQQYTALERAMTRLLNDIDHAASELRKEQSELITRIDTPFVSEETRQLIMTSLNEQIEHISTLRESTQASNAIIKQSKTLQ